MSGKPGIIPMIVLQGRSALRKEYSNRALTELSKELRKRGFESIYLVDRDGIEKNRPQLDLVQSLSDDFTILYEGGPRSSANIIDMIIAGAEIAYLGTSTLSSLEEIELAHSLTDSLGLKVDWDDGILGYGDGIEGRGLEDLLREGVEFGATDIVVPSTIIDRSALALPEEAVRLRTLYSDDLRHIPKNPRIDSVIIDFQDIPEESNEL